MADSLFIIHRSLFISHYQALTRRLVHLIWAIIFTIVCFAIVPFTHADTIKTITPRLTIREAYDDNLDLDDESENKDQDCITTILPGALFNLRGERTTLDLDLEAGLALYLDDASRNTRDYRGRISWGQQLTEYLSFNLNDTFLQSDDPITVYDDEVVDVRGGRRTQYYNTGNASFSYVFGPDDRLSAGYRNQYVDDRGEDNDDRVSHVGFANLEKWFGERFGIGFNLSHTDTHFEARDDYRQWNTGLTAYYRWTPYRFVYARYNLLDHDYNRDAFYYWWNDYQVHEGLLGINMTLSEYTSLSLDAGYFSQKYRSDYNEDQEGTSFNLKFSTRREKITWRIDASGGYEADYFSSEDLGPSQFAKGLVRMDYRLMEKTTLFATLDYRWNDYYEEEIGEDRVRATGGLRYDFWEWYTVSLQYAYNQRASDQSSRDYTDNRIMFELRWACPFEF